MSPSKREREYARRRHEKYLARQAALKAKRRRRQVLTGSILGLIALVGVVAVVINTTRDDATATAQPTPSASARVVADPSLAEGRTWTGTISTSVGDLGVELDGAAAPQAVASFISLAREGFFTGTSCHRLVTAGMHILQCGDPTGTGQGGPGYEFGPIENAPADDVYPAGTIAMARPQNSASMGSQFFFVYADSMIPSDSAGGYTVLGRVTDGLDVLKSVADAGITEGTESTPVTTVTIEGVEVQ